MCFWKWTGQGREPWELRETLVGNAIRRSEWERFLYTQIPLPEDPEEYDLQPKEGLAVTNWSQEFGVGLTAVHPPGGGPNWLEGGEECVRMLLGHSWHIYLVGGSQLFSSTLRIAHAAQQ